MKEWFSAMSRAMGQELNDKKVRLNDELKKINVLTMVQQLQAATQIDSNSVVLNAFVSFCYEDREI